MTEQLRILILEDRPADAELIERELRGEGFQFTAKRVWTKSDFLAELRNSPDVILADYTLPGYDGLSALKVAQEERPEIPFIFCSGSLGEETAIAAMHHGARDYVLKQKLARLGPAVRRALQESAAVRDQQRAEAQIRHLNDVLQSVRDVESLIVRERDPEKIFTETCKILVRTRGYRLVWVGLTESDSKRVAPAACAGSGIEFLKTATITWDETPTGLGPVGSALRNREVSVCQNTATDPDFAAWSEAALVRGYKSVAAAPMIHGNHLFGVLVVSADAPGAFDDKELRLLKELADNLAFALQSIEDERARKRAEANYRSIFENALEGIYQTTPDGRFLAANPAMARMFGYDSPEELMAAVNNIAQQIYVDPARREEFKRRLERDGEVTGMESPSRCKDGRIIWVSTNARVVRDATGRILYYEGTSVDITAHKRSEEALRNAEALYHSLVENLPQCVFRKDLAGRMTFADRHHCQMLGKPLEEVLGKTDADFYPAELADKYRRDDEWVVRSGETFETIERNCLPNGEERFVNVVKTPLRDADGQVVGVQGVYWDVTERQRAEQERVRLATAVEQAAESIVITDANGIIQYVNPAFEQISGYSRQEAVGQNPRVLKSGKHSPEFYKEVWDTLLRGEVWHGHFINKKKDGTFFEEDATITPVRDSAGHIANYIAVKRDVTQEVALEGQLRQSQKMEALGTLAGGVAHEINNPINGIMNYAQLISDRLPPDSPLRKFSAEIIKETDRVAQIVKSLLTFARQEKPLRQTTSLNAIINDALSLMRTVMRHDQITLAMDVPDGLPDVECHSQQIQQVVMNLLTNARDALNEKYPDYHEDKIIHIAARPFEKDGKSWIRVTVEDHGHGIPREVRGRLFDPFFTTKLGKGGTGLGLSISHGIAKDHSGELHFETETGRFTRFHLDLPVSEEKRS
ncbi:MAG: PAS domain S-box protein [Verrucomicrobia bacterium]|nr:PAS domain S-box protein [Verrucomicrobiota bacterium]